MPGNEVFNIFRDSRGDLWLTIVGAENSLLRWERATEKFYNYTTRDGLPRYNGPISFAEDARGSGAIWFGHYFGGLALWAVANAFWALEIARTGATPAADSWIHAPFLLGDVLLIAALAFALLSRDERGVAMIDAAILAAAGGAVVWLTITERYFEAPAADYFTNTGIAVLVCYGLVDVVTASLGLRLLVSGRLGTPLLLVVASGLALVLSDAAWNWLTVASTYIPGSWADLGWLLTALLAGVAALHPRMAAAFEAAPSVERRLRWSRMALLAGASFAPAAALAVAVVAGADTADYLGIAVAMALVSLLVLSRLVGLLRLSERSACELSRRNEQLLELDRLKDEFVASVSHELRTPLTSIRGYAELLREGDAGDLNDEQRDYLAIVERNVDRLLALGADLLDVAQARRGLLTLELVDCTPALLAREAVERARPAADARGIRLELEAGATPHVAADSSRLGQVLDNLLSNALKFSARGGRVTVRVRAEGERVVLEVQDDGMGIPAADLPHLFERFYRASAATEQAVQGTGLGLAIVHSIVEAHGGTIAVASRPGAGSTFAVRLPARRVVRVEELAA